MLPDHILRILESVAAGQASPASALQQLAWSPVEQLSNGEQVVARVDHHRALRIGFPEVVFCEGKTTEQVVAICQRIAAVSHGFLATRADDEKRAALKAAFPNAEVNDLARTVHLTQSQSPSQMQSGTILIASAGTGDIPVAEEAAVTARALGNPVELLYDVGVAGIHRLLMQTEPLARASVIIVVAGMEGALASVVGGLVPVPVIAVPTSVGYGASFGGIAALLAMLNSCASGVTVVNIDNGFGAACAAHRINQLLSRKSE
ncbi:MAG: nickel pincer cofactor biosynthesis protein LarB [Gemmatimonadota bacterium]